MSPKLGVPTGPALSQPSSHLGHLISSHLISHACRVFNRYYGAEGVRIISQATWQAAVGSTGRDAVAAHIQAVVDFDASQALASNYTVRQVRERGRRLVDGVSIHPAVALSITHAHAHEPPSWSEWVL